MALNTVEQLKQCTKCREILPLSSFGRDANQVSCLNIYCKACVRIRARKRIGTDAYRKYQREYRRSRLRRDPIFKAKAYAATAQWRKNNPARFRELHEVANYRRAMRILGNDHEEGITMDLLYARDNGVCSICGVQCTREHASIDHIIPVSRGGGHLWNNIQLAHGRCNTSKGNS